MRKQDYALLAQLIKIELNHAKRNAKSPSMPPGHFEGYATSLHCVARDFAKKASVDETKFLKACGIE